MLIRTMSSSWPYPADDGLPEHDLGVDLNPFVSRGTSIATWQSDWLVRESMRQGQLRPTLEARKRHP